MVIPQTKNRALMKKISMELHYKLFSPSIFCELFDIMMLHCLLYEDYIHCYDRYYVINSASIVRIVRMRSVIAILCFSLPLFCGEEKRNLFAHPGKSYACARTDCPHKKQPENESLHNQLINFLCRVTSQLGCVHFNQ